MTALPSEAKSGPTPLDLVHRGWDHLRAQRPLAAWASWQQALRLKPDDEAATRALEVLRDAVEWPEVARKTQRLRGPEGEDRRARWDSLIEQREATLSDPAEASGVFAQLVTDDEGDASAWWNLGVCRAWTGDNVEAIHALDRFVTLTAEWDLDAAAAAWTLAELLRHGGGAEELADEMTHSFELSWSEERVSLTGWLESRANVVERPAPRDPESNQLIAEGRRIFEWLDRPMPQADQIRGVRDVPRLVALLIVDGNQARISSPDRLAFESLTEELNIAFPFCIHDCRCTPLPLKMLDQLVATGRLPEGLELDQKDQLTRELVEDYFENRWIGRARTGLDGSKPSWIVVVNSWSNLHRTISAGSIPPEFERDPKTSTVSRAKLTGIIKFYEQMSNRVFSRSLYQGYPFDRLRRRVGLVPEEPSFIDAADLSCASENELLALDLKGMSDNAVLEASQSALGLMAWYEDDGLLSQIATELSNRSPALLLSDLALVHVAASHAGMGIEHALRILDQLEPFARTGGYRVRSADLALVRLGFLCWEARGLDATPKKLRECIHSLLDLATDDSAKLLSAARLLQACGEFGRIEANRLLARVATLAGEQGDLLSERIANRLHDRLLRKEIEGAGN
jgi:hypothetical protein